MAPVEGAKSASARDKELRAYTASEAVAALGIDTARAPQILWRVIQQAFRYRWRFALAMGACLGGTLANLMLPRLLGHAVDQAVAVTQHRHEPWTVALTPVAWTALLLVGASVLRGLFQMTAGYNAEHVGQSVGRDLRLTFFEKLQRLDFGFHDRIHSGDLITRGMLDLEGVRGFLEVGLQRIVQLVLLAGVGGWLLFTRDPLLASVTLLFLPVVGMLAGRMGIRLRLAWTRLQERMAVLTRVMEENLQGARVVRAFPARAHQMDAFDQAGNAALHHANQRIRIRARSMAQINGTYYAAMLVVLWLGSYRIAAGAITIGQLAEFLAFMTILQMPVRQISMVMNAGARAVSSGSRLFEILDRPADIVDAPGARPLALRAGTLRFENVAFRHDPDAPWAVRDVSFAVERGRTLGIVGPAGSGKSTLAHLAARFYDPQQGRILIDGQDIRTTTLHSLRTAVSLVAQDIFLFDDSVERNIAYAEPTTRRSTVQQASVTAQLHDHVAGLPRGYQTAIGERGSRLSGGQRQRAAIARSLLPDSAVLIFDDATSAVDAATEHRLRHALRAATADKATIIISHRLSSLMHADEIIVLDAGRIIERGSHAALVAADGYYALLYALQTTSAGPEADQHHEEVA
ncbi:ABC transporter ATP-binding protein/permease [Sphingobium sufflavum]|uniref:ABC transporter ATP-binding protein n=1 Tax=Sphingobium sufflavum TaxID=1129547 RepID=UPI001F18D38A|nr:ABC transporter ATP-binding protein [Sphingobium sufflavum]MCE7796127.1 ABC transporter ATP-binding protein/permease [Sphingobium sufflavum]